jgi:hypothetical protein
VTLDHKSVDLFVVWLKSLTLWRVQQQQTLISNTKAESTLSGVILTLWDGVRLATHLHQVTTIRMSGAILHLPHKPSRLTKRQIYLYLQQCSILELLWPLFIHPNFSTLHLYLAG